MPENRTALARIVGIAAAAVFVTGAAVVVVRPGDLGDDGPKRSPADTAAAEAMRLTLADFPPEQGWVVAADGIGDSDGESDFDSEECGRFEAALSEKEMEDETGSVESDTFERGAFTTPESSFAAVFSGAAVFESVEPAEAAMGVFGDPQLAECLGAEARASFQDEADSTSGLSLGEVTAASAPPPPVGDQAGAVRITTQLTAGTVAIPVTMDFVSSRRGRSLVFMLVLSIGTPLADAEAHALLQKMIDRAPAA